MASPALLVLFSFLSVATQLCYSAGNTQTSGDLLRSSCIHTRYPTLCIESLSAYAGSAKTPNDLAQAAVSVSLDKGQQTSAFVSSLIKLRGIKKRETAALNDCVDELSESLDELRRSLGELRHLRSGTFRWQKSNVETWVSAALTNENTCLDGFQSVDGNVKVALKSKISDVARVTSNALALINRLGFTKGLA